MSEAPSIVVSIDIGLGEDAEFAYWEGFEYIFVNSSTNGQYYEYGLYNNSIAQSSVHNILYSWGTRKWQAAPLTQVPIGIFGEYNPQNVTLHYDQNESGILGFFVNPYYFNPTRQPTPFEISFNMYINSEPINGTYGNTTWDTNNELIITTLSSNNIYFGTVPGNYIDPGSDFLIGNFTALNRGDYDTWDNTYLDFYNHGPPNQMLSVGGDVVIEGTVTTGNILQIGNEVPDWKANKVSKTIYFGGLLGDNAYDHCVIENRIYGTGIYQEKRELLLFSGNDSVDPDRIRLRAGQICFDTYTGATVDRNTESIKMVINSDGNVGIGHGDPQYKLDVSGTGRFTGNLAITNGGVSIGTTATPTTFIDLGYKVFNRLISLWGGSLNSSIDSVDYFGIGVNPGALRLNVDSAFSTFKFYGGNTYYGYIWNSGFVDTFTGQHKSFPHESLSGKTTDELSGLIVCASGEHISVNDAIPQRGQDGIMVSEAIPMVCLSSHMNDKTVFGVVSNVEDPESTEREDKSGAFTSTFKKIVGDTRIYVNSIGEGAIWVVNTNGSFVNGDYITTSNVAGYGQKQDSDTLKNYTVAKITMECDFSKTLVPKKRIKKKTVTETIEETVEEEYESNMPEEIYTYDAERDCYVKTIKDNITTKSRPVQQEYELRDSDGNIITEVVSDTITVEDYEALEDKTGYTKNINNYTRHVSKPVTYSGDKVVVKTVTHEVDDLDEYGNLQWEDHPIETETRYKIRYLDANGVETDEASAVHIAAFVGCTYHCG